MLWFALAVMTGLAVFFALWPLSARRRVSATESREAAFYRAQLAEIERDVERGQLPAAEAAAARAEAGRRLIAASADETGLRANGARGPRRIAAVFVLVAVPLFSLLAYGRLGSPDLPDAPLAQRRIDVNSPEGLEAAIAKIESRLAATPDDVKGWAALAPVYMRVGRFGDAANAYRQLLRLRGEDGALRADLGEALVATAEGDVTPEARAEFEKALTDAAGLPKARFYLALAAEQAGDARTAQETYEALAPEAKGRQAWMQGLRARLAALKGGDQPAAATSPGDAQFSPEQKQMIEGMVAQLAGRLADKGGSPEEWARLIRAYSVLRETDKAKDALASARKALAGDAPALGDIDQLARELGLAEAPGDAPFSPEQKQMIEGMVAQLAGRLAAKGGSPEEWARLIRAYSVLHETDKAKDALVSARKALASNAPALGDIDQLAHELGLGGGG